MTRKLYVFEDAHKWGVSLHQAAQVRGYDSELFDSPYEVNGGSGFLFMHMHNHPAVRAYHKSLMQYFATKPDLRMIPQYKVSMLFDDRAEQLRHYARWMPKTYYFTTPFAVRQFLDRQPTFPMLSRSTPGTIGANVRTITTQEEARKEVKQAFSDLGIRLHYDQRQHGYLIWQEFIPQSPHYRITAIGNDRLVGIGEAQENGVVTLGPCVLDNDVEAISALAWADEFFRVEDIRYGSIVVVKDAEGQWKMQDLTLSWHRSFYANELTRFVRSGRPGAEMWDVLLDNMDAGAFS